MSEVKTVTFASEAIKLFNCGRTLARRIDQTIEAWTPIVKARMDAAGVVPNMDKAPHAEAVKQVTLELFTEFLNTPGHDGGMNAALRDVAAIAIVKGVGFQGPLRDWKHLKAVLQKTGNLGSISPGLKYVYQTYNNLVTGMGYRERDKNAKQLEREAEAAKAVGQAAPVAAPTVSQEAATEGKPGKRIIEIPEGASLQEAVVALLQAYGEERGVDGANWSETLAVIAESLYTPTPELAVA